MFRHRNDESNPSDVTRCCSADNAVNGKASGAQACKPTRNAASVAQLRIRHLNVLPELARLNRLERGKQFFNTAA
jgi:hypothetical protein